MRLRHFIRTETEAILQDWQVVAQTLNQANDMDKAELRDHAHEMLMAIAEDIEQPQTDQEQKDKSLGLNSFIYRNKDKAAVLHATDRETSGFEIKEIVAEFRALRASIIKRWAENNSPFSPPQVEDLIRFNEAVDQAVTTSLEHYSEIKERQTRLLTTVLQATPDATYVLDPDRLFTYANQAAEELYGLPAEKIIGRDACDETFPFSSETQARINQVLITGQMSRSEITHAGAGGDGFYDHYLIPVLDHEGELEAIVGISHDITERKRAEEKIWHDANHDLLTGLPNRRLFIDRLEQAIEHSARNGLPLAILYIDLDGFKAVNDTMGHEVGDRVLRDVAKRLSNCIRKADTAARLGGDEFTVILTDLHANRDMRAVAEKISDALKASFKDKQGKVMQISASIGVTLCPKDGITPDDLLRNADRAMYKSKTSRLHPICFYGSAKTDPPKPDALVH